MDQAAVGATEARSDCRVGKREKEVRREKLDLPGWEICPTRAGLVSVIPSRMNRDKRL